MKQQASTKCSPSHRSFLVSPPDRWYHYLVEAVRFPQRNSLLERVCIRFIAALLVAVGLATAVPMQAASSDTRDLHEGNRSKASSTPYRSAHDERIRRANDRALAIISPSPQATTAVSPSPQTSIYSASWTSSQATLAYSLFFGVLGVGIFLLIALVRKDYRLATTPVIPPVMTPSEDELQFQTASLNDLRHGVVPHYYHLSDFLPNKGEIVIWAFHGVRHYRVETHSQWIGGSTGLNVRVVRGLWIHSGASHGHKVEYSSVNSEIGTLVFTNTALCFVGPNSVRIPFSHILALNTYSDGIGLHTDYASNSNQIFGDMHTDNVTFFMAAVSLLHKNSL